MLCQGNQSYSTEYVKLLNNMKSLKTEDAKLEMWGKVANGVYFPMDHAISLVVKTDREKMLYDKGF